MKNVVFLFIGTLFGVTLIKADAVSWFRMQEMFRFQGFQMYGIFMTAIPTAALGVFILRKLKVKTSDGDAIQVPAKKFHMGYIYGSLIFGIGWGLTGACPGPVYVQIGSGLPIAIVTLVSALAGTWVYSLFKDKLPH